jgi:signal transduction histidine kinase/ligand-binding sensor domain-containing protein/DNA-binding response OmpR family regulator
LKINHFCLYIYSSFSGYAMDRILKYPSLILFLLLLADLCFCQTPSFTFRHLTTKQGLSSNDVNVVFRDSRGFTWIGTKDGLNRFDGYSFRIFRHDPGNPASVSENDITCITEDEAGNLLIGTRFEGLNRVDFATEIFTCFNNDPFDPISISDNRINMIFRDSADIFWIGTMCGLNRFNALTGHFTHFMPFPDSLENPANQVLAIFKESHERYWIGTRHGLFHFNPDKKDFIQIPLHSPWRMKGFDENTILCIFQDSDGMIWIGTKWFLFTYSQERFNWVGPPILSTTDSTPNNFDVHTIIEHLSFGRKYLWMASNGGLDRYDMISRKFNHIMPLKNNPEGISNYALTSLHLDETGILWIGTRNSGVDILNLDGNQFTQIAQDSLLLETSASSFLMDSEGSLWVGITDEGLLQLDRDMNFKAFYKFRLAGQEPDLNCYIYNMFEDEKDNLWLADFHFIHQGFFLFDRKTGVLDSVHFILTPDHPSLPDGEHIYMHSFLQDHNGYTWFATSHGLFNNSTKKKLELISIPIYSGDSLIPVNVWDFLPDNRDNLWIATHDHGLYGIKNWSGISAGVSHFDQDRLIHLKFDGVIRSLFRDKSGQIWLGTSNELCWLDLDDTIIKPISDINNLLADNLIYHIGGDTVNNLWLHTKNGLIRFNPNDTGNSSSKLFKRSDGLPFDQFNERSFYQARDGRIFLGGVSGSPAGFLFFDPNAIKENHHIPTTFLTDFRVNQQSFEMDTNISVIKKIRLKYNQNFFSFEFAALDYVNPEDNLYAYYLEGLENDWIYCGRRRFASYTGVSPGTYTFRVKGSNNDGYWNEEGTSIHISILPPFWKTWWAYTLYVLLLAGGIVAWRQYDLKRQRLKHALEIEHIEARKLKELDSLKSRFFANISHEFRTPLTLILGPLQQLFLKTRDEQMRQDITIMQRNARRLQNLINQLLDLSRLESGKMELHAAEENIVSLVKSYVQQFESLARHKGIELVFSSEREDIPAQVDRDKVEKILYNLLGNAFKWTGEGGRIQSAVGSWQLAEGVENIANCQLPIANLPEQCIAITISDTGCGIPPDKLPHIFDRFYQADDSYTEGTGIGLALTKELVELHGGAITVESVVNQGSVFRVFLPVGKEFLRGERRKERGERRDKGIEQEEMIGVLTRNAEPSTRNTERETRNAEPLVLIVEDNADLRLYLRGILGKEYQILEAGSGRQGLAKALEYVPDLVLTDVMMPEMDGYELSRNLKTDERTSHIPVILLTARASRESRIEGLETGADDFVTKPFDAEELLVRIRNLIDQRKKLRERYIKDFEVIKAGSKEQPLSLDEKFLQKARSVVEKNLADPEYGVERFASDMAMSRVQLHRKLRALIDQPVTEFIRTIRLNYAVGLLRKKAGTISEIAYDAGFNNPTWFTISFKKKFGLSPSDYLEQLKKN